MMMAHDASMDGGIITMCACDGVHIRREIRRDVRTTM